MTQPPTQPPGQQPEPTRPIPPVPPASPPTGPPPTSPPPTSPPPSAPPAQAGRPADRSLVIRAGLGVLVVGLTVLALAVEENGQRGYEDWTTWAIFATAVAAVHLLPLVWRADPRRVWDVVAVASVGLGFYWLALSLPQIGNATSFAQTLAVAFAGAHLWILPGRR